MFERSSGILLHPTSLPSKYGIGDLGPEAYNFVDFLKLSKQKLWQILPLNPPGYGNSPYQCYSAFAGNPLLISIDKLLECGLLKVSDLGELPNFCDSKVLFEEVKTYKEKLFRKAFQNFNLKNSAYEKFVDENFVWLDNYATFMSLRKKNKFKPWNKWEFTSKADIDSEEKEYHKFLQFLFFIQLKELKEYANKNGIKIIGDIPIYVSYDSSDVWGNPELFKLDEEGNPITVAGVPPDYFSKTGQLWGNPIYRWDKMKENDYYWWRMRFEKTFELVDFARIDHFRGFEAYWEVPGTEKTAINGRWVKGPNSNFFATLIKYLGELPIIAEDLGLITKEVINLKKEFNFPGMRVLQFEFEAAFKKGCSPYINEENIALYTGTHDNDTILGWYKDKLEQKYAKKYLSLVTDLSEKEICWYFIEVLFKSRAKIAIVPLQDLLCLDSDARMNTPGTVNGNWQWRFKKEQLNEKISRKLKIITEQNKR